MNNNSKIYQTYNLARYKDSSVNKYMQDFVREEPLHIQVGDKPYSVVMRTPGEEIAHAAGFCFSEGLIESPEDIASIGFCSDLDENSVMVNLIDERKKLVSEQIERGGFLSQTSCGICGREMIEDLIHNPFLIVLLLSSLLCGGKGRSWLLSFPDIAVPYPGIPPFLLRRVCILA